MLIRQTGYSGKDKRYIPGSEKDVQAEQEFIANFLREHPEEQTFYAFDLKDGKERCELSSKKRRGLLVDVDGLVFEGGFEV